MHGPQHNRAEFDEGALRPPTVEELAAAERADKLSFRDRAKRPIMVALATGLVLAGAVGAVALSRGDTAPSMIQPVGGAAPFGVSYVDGFGEHSPKPVASPKRSSKAAAKTVASPSKVVEQRIPASPSPSETVTDMTVMDQEVSAVYWITTSRGSYDVYVWVHNSGTEPATWQVRVTLPAGASVSANWAAKRKAETGNTWIFTSSQSAELGPDRTYLFAFSGSRPSGSFALTTCTVNGTPCESWG